MRIIEDVALSYHTVHAQFIVNIAWSGLGSSVENPKLKQNF